MTYFTPLVSDFEQKKMKKAITGPREETLMLIRHFARIYAYDAGQRQKIRKILVN